MTGTQLKSYPLVVVTGAGGWLGRRLVKALTTTPLAPRIRCLMEVHEPTKELRDLGHEVVVGDLCDPVTRKVLMKDAEGGLVIHTAGVIRPLDGTAAFDAINNVGTLDLLKEATTSRISRFVATSCNSQMGANPIVTDRFTEDSPYNPYMKYGRSKYMMELGLREAMGRDGAPEIVIARAPWFYGPGQPEMQTQFFSMIKNGKFPLMGKGLNRRSMSYVDTLADGLLLCASVPSAADRIYWLADENPYAMHEIVDTVRAVLSEDFGMQVSARRLSLPSVVSDVARVIDASLQSVGIYHSKFHVLSEMNQTIACDVTRARTELGFKPWPSLRAGLRNSVASCLERGHKI